MCFCEGIVPFVHLLFYFYQKYKVQHVSSETLLAIYSLCTLVLHEANFFAQLSAPFSFVLSKYYSRIYLVDVNNLELKLNPGF
jgi:hypothetical protein